MILYKIVVISAFLVTKIWSSTGNEILNAEAPAVQVPQHESMHVSAIPFEDKIRIRLQECVSSGDIKNILVLGARPHQHDHFDFSMLGAVNVFYLDYQESSWGTSKEEDIAYSTQYEQEGGFIHMSFNNKVQREALVRIFANSLDLIVPDGNVCGYFDFNPASLNDILSMLRFSGQFILDQHRPSGDFYDGNGLSKGFSINFDPSSIDEEAMKAIESKFSANMIYSQDLEKYVSVLRTFEEVIAGNYYNHDATVLTTSVYCRVRIDSNSSAPLSEKMLTALQNSHLDYMRDWMRTYISLSCILSSIVDDSSAYLSSSAVYKHSRPFVITRT